MLWNPTISRFFAHPLRAALFAGLLLFAAVLWWLTSARVPAYQPDDLAPDQPITAVHGLPGGAHYPALPAGAAAPRMELSPSYFDFGRIDPDQVVEHTFILRNRGSSDLLIRRAYTTCECTRAQISAAVIPPGKVALIKVSYDPRLHAAPGATLRRGVILESNDPENAQAEVWVQASLDNE